MSAFDAVSPPVASMSGELPSHKSLKELEFELAEKNRYIKKLETQMLATSDSRSISKATQDDESSWLSSAKPCSGDNLCWETQRPDDTRSLATREPSLDRFAMGSAPVILQAHETLSEEALDFAIAAGSSENLYTTQRRVGGMLDEKDMPVTYRVTPAQLGFAESLTEAECFAQRRATSLSDETCVLKRMLEEVISEQERKDAELGIFQNATSVDMLRHEYSSLMTEIKRLSEQKQGYRAKMQQLTEQLQGREAHCAELELRLSTNDTQASPISSAHWRSKAVMLEEELKHKADVLTRLRQRELWFETQLRRQAEANVMPLEALLNEVRTLQDSSGILASKTTESRGMPHNLRDRGKAKPSASEMRLPEAPACLPPQQAPLVIPRTLTPVPGGSTLLPAQYC